MFQSSDKQTDSFLGRSKQKDRFTDEKMLMGMRHTQAENSPASPADDSPATPADAAGDSPMQFAFIKEQKEKKEGIKMPVKKGEVQRKEGPESKNRSKGESKDSQATQAGADSFPWDVLGPMNHAFDVDFSTVDVFKNDPSAQDMGALAYTQGNEVHFAPGQYDPSSQKGKELIGHELTHVVQQREGKVQPTQKGNGIAINDNPDLEAEADQLGQQAAQGKMTNKVQGKGGGVQRQEDDALRVEKGQITFDAEGNDQEDSIYFTRHAHWPGGSSGVTIGRGYDLGHRGSRNVIEEELQNVGISVDKFSGAIGLKGDDAKNWLNANSSTLPTITHDQQKQLFSITYQAIENDTRRLACKDDVTAAYGETNWDTLLTPIKEVLVDLRYRGDYTPASRRLIQAHVADNDLEAFYQKLSKRSLWPNVPEDRFNRRVNYLQGAIENGNNQSEILEQTGPVEHVSTNQADAMDTQLSAPQSTAPIETSHVVEANNPATTFIVPPGWGLNQIAVHLGVSVEALKEANASKLKTWNDVQGFNANEHITIPTSSSASKATTNAEAQVKPVSDEDKINNAQNDYKAGRLSMPAFGRLLLPYVSTLGTKILSILENLPRHERDNFAFVLAANSSDTQLASFNKELLLGMRDELGGFFNTTSWKENWAQKDRVVNALGQKATNVAGEENTTSEDIIEPNNLSEMEKNLNDLLSKERLTPEEISYAREIISSLEVSKQASYYLLIQTKVNYKNQRNNQSDATLNDLERNDWMTKYNIDTAGDIMCNLTSMAMALETIGVSNPDSSMQFEDYLEQLRLEKFGDEQKRTDPTTWSKLALELNVQTKMITIDSNEKSTIENKLLPELEKGNGISLSVFSYNSGKGHIVRLQAINTNGLIVDDPYGDVSQHLGDRENGANGYRKSEEYDNRNSKVSEEGKGEDNLWKWEQIQNTIIKYAMVFFTENKQS